MGDNRVVIVLTVPKGLDKPYFDKNGVIWLKTGAMAGFLPRAAGIAKRKAMS
ncbi:MAG: hypothetical protein K6F46_11955 [Desulfovibrio sp.]|nr:hypothetical protein [Desulfovibrio sp.]